ncbi:hypothetical protein Q7P37_006638 [Cladosporium fusiforme]
MRSKRRPRLVDLGVYAAYERESSSGLKCIVHSYELMQAKLMTGEYSQGIVKQVFRGRLSSSDFILTQPVFARTRMKISILMTMNTHDAMHMQPRKSLVTELQEIAKHKGTTEKAHEWADNLLCLRLGKQSPTCFLEWTNHLLESEKKKKFVAVSWTWEASAHEADQWGKYSTESPARGGGRGKRMQRSCEKKLEVRNCVLDRVVKYLKCRGIDLFWIDKACIDQDSSNKAKAINSMDLVYKKATHSVGLLSSPIETTEDAKMLAYLLRGKMSVEKGRGEFEFRPNVHTDKINRVFTILQRLVEDTWWKRAWIYQEEYLSGTRMDLLITVGPGVCVPPPYGDVRGEFCVRATLFRKQATMFLLACRNSSNSAACSEMLKTVEKYSITLEGEDGGLKPMSSRIFADIQRRDVGYSWDRLAITANACAYDIRLDAERLRSDNRNLEQCLLAQFLLNGEIFTHHPECDPSLLEKGVSRFLDRLQPELTDLPVSGQRLTFLKYCRLPKVKFRIEGLQTKGYIWELPAQASSIDTAGFASKLDGPPDAMRDGVEESPWASRELRWLAVELKKHNQDRLANKLINLREKYRKGRRRHATSPAAEYMDLMACNVVQAIKSERRLTVARLRGRKQSNGIFIPQPSDADRPMHVLTTWQKPEQDEEPGKAVSLRVNMHSSDPNRVTSVAGWINGLVFFVEKKKRDREDVIIEWPQSWKRAPDLP